ncbi:hypothetical protein FDF26_11520 [Clostridium botulinum]|nr:hypothetical protein [Clostridium botulinum]
MGNFLIKKIIYHGDNYYFESPELNKGIVILEGDNEHGKSTFMDLIYFGLGGKVPGFNNDKKCREKHTQIYNDTNNYVELLVNINGEEFEFTRYFIENKIYIVDNNKNVKETNIYRNSSEDNDIFSDWVLNKLNIDVFDIVQGTKKFKIGFSDLMRLIYHDQKTEVNKIYKSPENDNFVSDSVEIRMAIFEVLIGSAYSEYYELLGKYKIKNKDFEEKSAILNNYDNFLNEIINDELTNTEYILNEINDKRELLNKIEIERNIARTQKNTSIKVFREVEEQKEKIKTIEYAKSENRKIKRSIEESISKIIFLIEQVDWEVKEIEKIRFVNNKLNLFSPNTCPYCLMEVHRDSGKCICGNNIDEEEYEKFFYSDNEYLQIISVKNKSKKSLSTLLENKKNRLLDIDNTLNKLDIEENKCKKYVNDLLKDINSDYNSAYVAKIDDRISEIKEMISSLETAKELSLKRDKLLKNVNGIRNELEQLKINVNEKLNYAEKDLVKKKKNFNEIYDSLMKKADKYCYNAYIGDDYMPYTNNGEYRARSSLVSKRLMYFLTLLIISLNSKSNYPRFLMIDTPNKEGIDPENLIKILELLSNIDEYMEDNSVKYQIILTTGIGVYPDSLKDKVFLTLENDQKLLIEK